MIKTTEEILEMCEEFHNKLEINKQNNNIILDDPRPLFHKEWVDKESLIKYLDNELNDLHRRLSNKELPDVCLANFSGAIIWLESLKEELAGERE